MRNQKKSFIDPYKIFKITDKLLFKKKLLNKRLLSPKSSLRSSSDISPNISKRMKQVTLSNFKYKRYLSRYDKLTKENSFKSPENSFYPIRKNIKYLPVYKTKQLKENTKKESIFKITNSFQNIDEGNNYNNFFEENNNKMGNIEEMPYGFKYKDTKIVIDKSKLNKNLSNQNIKYSSSKIYKKLKFNILRNKERDLQNKNNNLFLNFSNGKFFENNSKIYNNKNIDNYAEFKEFKSYDCEYKMNENEEYNLNKEKNISFLFEE